MHGLIKLVNNNHLDNYLREILALVYYGSIVNNRPKNDYKMNKQTRNFSWEKIDVLQHFKLHADLENKVKVNKSYQLEGMAQWYIHSSLMKTCQSIKETSHTQ